MNINYVAVYVLGLLHFFPLLSKPQTFDYPTANLSTSWTNSPSLPHSVPFTDGSTVRSILLRGSFGPRFACGFFCNGTCDSYLFAIFIVQTNSASGITSPAIGFPQVVWSANRNNPVRINSTLQLRPDGDLVLTDGDGTVAWSTNTGNRSVAGMNLTDSGNLVLFDENNRTVWQSFDHPTDCLVPGQKLVAGKKLVPSVSATNWTEMSLLELNVSDHGMAALVRSYPPQVYFDFTVSGTKINPEPTYVAIQNGSFGLFVNSSDPTIPDMWTQIPEASSAQYARFSADGHLRLYEWRTGWQEVADVLGKKECFYPTVCGNFGICSNGQCSCPATADNRTTFFRQIQSRHPSLGCYETTPLSCENSRNHDFIELNDTTYAAFRVDLWNVDLQSCREACSRNCSCRAAMFQYGSNSSAGNCFLPNQVFSLINNVQEQTHYNSTVFLKVENVAVESTSPQIRQEKKNRLPVILGSSIGSVSGLLILISVFAFLSRKRNNDDENDEEEDDFDQVPGMLARFSYEDLKTTTENFSRVLGEGGFGSVFAGTMADGTKIAVKRLNGLVQVKKSFLAEVESIGSIHHVNLVRLLGFCAEKSHRILVYEFIPNGSLDKWIFHGCNDSPLNWNQKKKIILDIAKGLSYLHEDCRQKIIHMDIKPQNILLDQNYNAKICDFGLSKLIDRDQSKVVTTMRGTPGYLAPEWLSSVITEKIDVYSFGIVVMEILCGRKNFDAAQPEEQMHLLKLFLEKEAENGLLDLVKNGGEVEKSEEEEMVKMMRVAGWCVQKDYAERPGMSMVVKVLEGNCDVEDDVTYKFWNPPLMESSTEVTQLLPVVLSGPR